MAARTKGTGVRRWWLMARHQRIRWIEPRRVTRHPRVLQDRSACIQPEFAVRYPAREVSPKITTLTVRAAQLELLLSSHLQWQLMGWAATGAKNGIDYRYPLLDRRLIEFSLGLPATMMGRQGWDRYLFRYAMRDRLPAGACRKQGMQEVALSADRQRLNYAFDSEIFNPLIDKLLAEGWPWQVLYPKGVLQCRERSRLIRPATLNALRLDMLLNPDLESAVLAHLQAIQGI